MTLDPTQTKLVAEYQHDVPLLTCAFDPSGRFVLAGGRDRGLVCLNTETGMKTRLDGHETWISHIVRVGTELLLSADFGGVLIAWDCSGETPKQRWKISAHPNTIYALASSLDGKLCATGDREGTIRIWQMAEPKQLYEFQVEGHPVYGLAFHPQGNRLISADRQPKKPRLKLREFATAKELWTIDVPELSAYRRVEDIEWGGIRGITISPDGKTIVACGSNGYAGAACAMLFETATGNVQRKLNSTLKGFYYAPRFHSQGFLLTAGGDIKTGEVRIWDPEKEEPLASIPTPGPCTSLDLHPDGGRFVVTQTLGKSSYPDSGALAIREWSK